MSLTIGLPSISAQELEKRVNQDDFGTEFQLFIQNYLASMKVEEETKRKEEKQCIRVADVDLSKKEVPLPAKLPVHVHDHPLHVTKQAGNKRCTVCHLMQPACVMYTCQESACNVWVCVDCTKVVRADGAGLDKSVTTPLHPHQLQLKDKVYSGRYQCNVCRFTKPGKVYHCEACQFDLCPACSLVLHAIEELPQATKSPYHPHGLKFHQYAPQERRTCSLCRTNGHTEGFVCAERCVFFECVACVVTALRFELTELPPTLTSKQHEHTLRHMASVYPHVQGRYICNSCRGHFAGAVYHCAPCQFDYCLACTVNELHGQRVLEREAEREAERARA